MSILGSLNREQREAIGLLQIGTFLEYFDFMLYVHMAVLLNEIFFPKSDLHTTALLTAFAFCSTYVLRPFGALFFGWIGDNIGRKTTVIITTTMMSLSCVVMATLPTYAQIGISAAWIVTICRLVQGMSSMGEIMGAMVYVTEITRPPVQYPAVAFIGIASAVGGVAALGVATLVTRNGFDWRIAFWVGATIAVIGSVARTRLRETPEFVDMKRRLQKNIDESKSGSKKQENHSHELSQWIAASKTEKINRKTLISCFLIQCGWPLTFYLTFMYFHPILKIQCGYSAEDIILHNFFLSLILLFVGLFWARLSYKVHPLRIIKGRASIFIFLILCLPFILTKTTTQYQIFLLQALLLIASLAEAPACSVFIAAMPVFRRFTATSFIYALSRALVYIVTSLGLVYLTESFSHFGLWIITFPLCVGFLWSVNHFEVLEGLRPDKPTPIKEEAVLGKAA